MSKTRTGEVYVYQLRRSLHCVKARIEKLRACRAQHEVDEHYAAAIESIKKVILYMEDRRQHNATTRRRALKLYQLEGEEALPLKIIAYRVGVPRQTIDRWAREENLPLRLHPVRKVG